MNIDRELQNNLDQLKKCVPDPSQIVNSDGFDRVLEEIQTWIQGQTGPPSKGQKVIRLFKPDDTCACLNKKLDDALTQFGVCILMDARIYSLLIGSLWFTA
jgi:hypothetical protein